MNLSRICWLQPAHWGISVERGERGNVRFLYGTTNQVLFGCLLILFVLGKDISQTLRSATYSCTGCTLHKGAWSKE